MSTAHRNSYLPSDGFVHALRSEDHLFSFDNVDLVSSRGLSPSTNSGANTMLLKSGRYGPGVFVDGNLQYDISKLYLRDHGAICCWMKLSAKLRTANLSSAYALTLTSAVNGNWNDDVITLYRQLNDGYLQFVSRATSGGSFTEDPVYWPYPISDIPLDSWIHVVMQWNKGGLPSGFTKELYLNGERSFWSNNTTALPNSVLTRLSVGSQDGANLRATTAFSDLIVSRRSFTADEVDMLYRGDAAVYDPYDLRIIL